MSLRDLPLRRTYDPDVCPDIVSAFYVPALAEAVAYDRATFTFTASGLVAAAAGLAGLLRNDGRVRIICEPTQLDDQVREAILRGYTQALEEAVPPQDLTRIAANDIRARGQLDLITWLIAQGRLEIRIALRHTSQGIFHAKTGLMTDADGHRISFNGSPNETASGWSKNYERFRLFRSWHAAERADVQEDREHFARLWNNQSPSVEVIPVPEAYREHFRQIAPRVPPTPPGIVYWQKIRDAIRNDPATTAATAPTVLWPHQAGFFHRHAGQDTPDRLLIADEVGLGKTIQAGILLKTRMNQGRVKRLLILAPKPACRQWQDELRYKFNLRVPVLHTGPQTTLAFPDGTVTAAPDPPWETPELIASYQWLRLHAAAFLQSAPRYDMVIVDEAHRARFSEVTNPRQRRPNAYLKLLRQLADRTAGLLLLTATPMQIHEAELHALLELLEPTDWDPETFRRFYDASAEAPLDQWRFMAERYRPLSPDLKARDEKLIHSPNRAYVNAMLQRDPDQVTQDIRRMQERAPAKRLMSRHTRETLRQYAREGRIKAVVPARRIHPVDIPMNAAERDLYDDIDILVRDVYAGAPDINRTALGFIMTTYRLRLGSSPRAFAQTCRNHLTRQENQARAWREMTERDDDERDDDLDAPLPGATLTRQAEERLRAAADDARRLEVRDTKLGKLRQQLERLTQDGHRKIIIFTQFRDTLRYLEERLGSYGYPHITCLFGQDETTLGSRVQRINDLREAASGLLIATETASESLNLQFCTAMVNYDIPWNPMTLEQRIGRIDRIGQEREVVDIVNLFHADTAAWDAYQAMRERLANIHGLVGAYQPILYDPAAAHQLAGIIRGNADAQTIRAAVHNIASSARLNLDVLNSPLDDTAAPAAAVTMADLRQALENPTLMPEGWRVEHVGGLHWDVYTPTGLRYTVTTDRESYEYAPQHLEWFGPGSPAFPQ